MKSTFSRTIAALLMTLGLIAQAQASAIIENGSFENPLNPATDWSYGDINWITGLWAAADGDYSIDLSGDVISTPANDYIEQTFDTIIGQTYSVSYQYAANTGSDPLCPASSGVCDDRTFSVLIDGVVMETLEGVANQWQTSTFTFEASNTSTTLRFESPLAYRAGAALDNVVVATVPAPGTLALLAFGLAGITLRKKRIR